MYKLIIVFLIAFSGVLRISDLIWGFPRRLGSGKENS